MLSRSLSLSTVRLISHLWMLLCASLCLCVYLGTRAFLIKLSNERAWKQQQQQKTPTGCYINNPFQRYHTEQQHVCVYKQIWVPRFLWKATHKTQESTEALQKLYANTLHIRDVTRKHYYKHSTLKSQNHSEPSTPWSTGLWHWSMRQKAQVPHDRAIPFLYHQHQQHSISELSVPKTPSGESTHAESNQELIPTLTEQVQKMKAGFTGSEMSLLKWDWTCLSSAAGKMVSSANQTSFKDMMFET